MENRMMATLTVKISILHLYISIFGLTSSRFCQIVWTVMGICVVSSVALIIHILALCQPLASFWDKSIHGKCGSLVLTYQIRTIIITVEDIVVLVLPMRMLWRLQVATTKKIGAIFIFGIGFGICLVYGVHLKYATVLRMDDITGSTWMFIILGTMEPMLGIICACLPVLPAIIAHYSEKRILARNTIGGNGVDSRKFGPTTKDLNNSTGHNGYAEFGHL